MTMKSNMAIRHPMPMFFIVEFPPPPGDGLAVNGVPQFEQNRALSGFAKPQFGQFTLRLM